MPTTVVCSVCGDEVGRGPNGLGLFNHAQMHRREYQERTGTWPDDYQDVRDMLGNRNPPPLDQCQLTLQEAVTDDEQTSLRQGGTR